MANEKKDNKVADCILHNYELFEGPLSDLVGTATITIENREPFSFAIWGNPNGNAHEFYMYLPTFLEENDDDNLQFLYLDEMLYDII